MRCSSVSARGAGFSPSLLSSLPSGFRSSAFTAVSATTRAWPRQSQESRLYATASAAPTVREMVKAYRKVIRTPLNIQQVVKIEQEAVLEDGSAVFVHREQPVFAPPGPLPEYNKDVTSEELLEIVKLRKEDPEKWTITALSEKFRVARGLIIRIAPTTDERHAQLKEQQEEQALIKSWSRPKFKGRHFGLQGGLKLNKQRMLAKAKFQKMVDEAGGLKNLMRAQNFVTHYSRKRPTKNNRGRRVDKEEYVPGETDDAPMKKVSELDSLIDWVTPQESVRTIFENRANIFKMNEDRNYKPPGPIPKAAPAAPAGGKPAAAPAGGKGGAPAGKQAPPPKKK